MTTWLSVPVRGTTLGVFSENGKQGIRGVILAEEGPFKTPGRGEFDKQEIGNVVKLGRAESAGLKVRFTHPDLSSNGLGKYLGRAGNVRQDTISRDGKPVAIARGDLTFSDSAYATPNGNLAQYVMDLTKDDDNALGMSLVIGDLAEEFRREKNGTLTKGKDGEPLPPLWRVGSLRGVDVVDSGDATNSMLGVGLSIEGLPDEIVRKAAVLLKAQFGGKDRAFVETHLRAYVDRVLAHYWPEDAAGCDTGVGLTVELTTTEDLRRRLALRGRLVER